MSTPDLEPSERILLTCGASIGARPPGRIVLSTRVLGSGRLWLTNHRLIWKKDLISFPWWTGRKTLVWRLDELSEATPSLSMWGIYGALVIRAGDERLFIHPNKWTSASELFTSGSLSKRIAELLHSARVER